RVDGVSVETDGIVVAMTFPGDHCIGEYVIPYRNAISVNAGLGQCSSTFLSPGLRFAPPWAVWLLPPRPGLILRQTCVLSGY
ncbi:MAG: hypothetical protein IKB16_14315, partial [Lentisphaeria bacterium]|nr:hypothetical protein [Lentisphaeria bacterium]